MHKKKVDGMTNIAKLKDLLLDFSYTTDFDVALYESSGENIFKISNRTSLCELANDKSICVQNLLSSAQKSKDMGEPYIFTGCCGLVMGIVAITSDDNIIGFATCGPVMLWEADELAIAEIKKRINIPLNFDIHNIMTTSCKKLNGAMNIINEIIDNFKKNLEIANKNHFMLSDELKKVDKSNILSHQNAETNQSDKLGFNLYPAKLEKELLNLLQLGDRPKATKLTNDLLMKIFYSANGDLSTIKARLYEFFAFLSRASVEFGAKLIDVTDNIKKTGKLFDSNLDFTETCILSTEIINGFFDLIYENRHKNKHSDIIIKAVEIIEKDFNQYDISLTEVANKIGVSKFYLSHLFRSQMHITFFNFLTKVRLDIAKSLLRTSHLQIYEISTKCGFIQTSSFNKTFKKVLQITPGEYRNLWKL